MILILSNSPRGRDFNSKFKSLPIIGFDSNIYNVPVGNVC